MLWWLIYRGAPVSAAMDSPLPHRAWVDSQSRDTVPGLLCFVLPGFIIFPYVREFYAMRLPGVGEIVAMQFLLRGPVFLMVCPLPLRMFRLPSSRRVSSWTYVYGLAAWHR